MPIDSQGVTSSQAPDYYNLGGLAGPLTPIVSKKKLPKKPASLGIGALAAKAGSSKGAGGPLAGLDGVKALVDAHTATKKSLDALQTLANQVLANKPDPTVGSTNKGLGIGAIAATAGNTPSLKKAAATKVATSVLPTAPAAQAASSAPALTSSAATTSPSTTSASVSSATPSDTQTYAQQIVDATLAPQLNALTRQGQEAKATTYNSIDLLNQMLNRQEGDTNTIYGRLANSIAANQTTAANQNQATQTSVGNIYDQLANGITSQGNTAQNAIQQELARVGQGAASPAAQAQSAQDASFLSGLAQTSKANALSSLQSQLTNNNSLAGNNEANAQAAAGLANTGFLRSNQNSISSALSDLAKSQYDISGQKADLEATRGSQIQQLVTQLNQTALDNQLKEATLNGTLGLQSAQAGYYTNRGNAALQEAATAAQNAAAGTVDGYSLSGLASLLSATKPSTTSTSSLNSNVGKAQDLISSLGLDSNTTTALDNALNYLNTNGGGQDLTTALSTLNSQGLLNGLSGGTSNPYLQRVINLLYPAASG